MTLTISATFTTKGKALDPKQARAIIKTALDTVAKNVASDYKATMRTWKRNKTEPKIESTEDSRKISVNSKVYNFLDYGTKPHRIFPKTARRLAFRGNFTPKTTPNVLGSSAGGSSGAYVYRAYVNHPGSKARNFTKTLYQKRKNDLKNELDKGLASL